MRIANILAVPGLLCSACALATEPASAKCFESYTCCMPHAILFAINCFPGDMYNGVSMILFGVLRLRHRPILRKWERDAIAEHLDFMVL